MIELETLDVCNVTKNDVLIVVDVQNDFCAGGALAVPNADDVIDPINRIAPLFDHVILTKDWHPADHRSFASQHPGRKPFDRLDDNPGITTLWPDHCVQGTRGAKLHPRLHVPNAKAVILKGTDPLVDSYSAYRDLLGNPTGLAGLIRDILFRTWSRTVYVAGLATDFCVADTACHASEYRATGHVALIWDACRAVDVDGSLEEAVQRMALADVARVDSSQLVQV